MPKALRLKWEQALQSRGCARRRVVLGEDPEPAGAQPEERARWVSMASDRAAGLCPAGGEHLGTDFGAVVALSRAARAWMLEHSGEPDLE